MKIKLKSKIKSIFLNSDSLVRIDLDLDGKVESERVQGKEAEAKMTLFIKPLYAENLRFGQNITVEINTTDG